MDGVMSSPKTLTVRELLATLVGFDTTSSKSNLSLVDFVEDYLNVHGIASTRIPSPDGAKADLLIRRSGIDQPIKFNLTRATIHIRSVDPRITMMLSPALSESPPARAMMSSSVRGPRTCTTPGRATAPTTDTPRLSISATLTLTCGEMM